MNTSKKTKRYMMFGLLYFTQGTVFSYFTALNALYFLDNGLSMTDVGIFASIAMIPFVIKVFFGMLSDKVNLFGAGHRKPYILLGLFVQAVCLVVVPMINLATGYWWFVAVAFVLQTGMALYDTCTDGYALDTTLPEDESTIQGFMVGGRAMGVILTASVVGLLAQHVSWSAVFWLLAALTLVPIPLVLRLQEAERTQERVFNWSAFAAFKDVKVISLGMLGLLFFLIIAGSNQLMSPFLEQTFQLELSLIGYYTTLWGIGVVLGGVTGGWLIRKIGRKNGTLTAMAMAFVGVAGLSIIQSPGMAWPLVLIYGIAYGTNQTVYFSLAMGFTDKRIAASMFSILMALTNIGQGIGMAMAGLMADGVGFRWTFFILAAMNVLAFFFLPQVFGKKKGLEPAGV
ncbi:MAG: MFS transporter [Anaerolineaceae bacterium]|nr:MFS transporter [Anaerolineaceae bacterium]